jgi:hypothetical protein
MINFWPRVTASPHHPTRDVPPPGSLSRFGTGPVLALGGWFWRQPLVHFLLLGALLFGLHGVVQGAAVPAAAPTLTLDGPTLDQLRSDWQRQWRREPIATEWQTLVDQALRDQVLYQEALALGLDQNDLIIRRRLIQKMEFLMEGGVDLAEPQEADLQAYLEAHADRYQLPPRFSFDQIYFSGDQRGDRADGAARQLLARLQSQPRLAQPLEKLGDRTLLPPTYTLATPQQLAHSLGATFAEQVAGITQLGWQGPFTSVYGSHLLRVTDLQPGHPATLAEVRSEVQRDWQRDRQAQQGAANYQRLRDRYRLIITPAAQAQMNPSLESVGEGPP